MDDIGSRDLAFYRLQSAWERLLVAEDMFRLGHYRDCLSKAYRFGSSKTKLMSEEYNIIFKTALTYVNTAFISIKAMAQAIVFLHIHSQKHVSG